MKPLVSQLWPQFMADPDFAACFGQVIVEHAQMLRQERQVVFTLRSAAPLDKGLCARLLASLQPDYEGFELKIDNLFGYATLDEAALRELMDKKLYQAPVNRYFRPGEYETVINRSLQTYHPAYWQARAKDLKEKGQPAIQRKSKERER